MFVNNTQIPGDNLPIKQSEEMATDKKSLPEGEKEERMTQISKKALTQNEDSISEKKLGLKGKTKIEQLRKLFESRYYQSGRWPKAYPKAKLDCEGFTHYLMKGKIGKFEENGIPEISEVSFEQKHQPYTCYQIWCPSALWVREEQGFWKPVHFFMYLEDDQYVSHNGAGPFDIFNSFEEMLRADAFPGGFVTRDSKITKDFEQAVIGESLVGTIQA